MPSLLWGGLAVLVPLGLSFVDLGRADAAPARAKPTPAPAVAPAPAAADPSAAPSRVGVTAGVSAGVTGGVTGGVAGGVTGGVTSGVGVGGSAAAAPAPAATGAPPTDRPAAAPKQLDTAGPKEEAARAHYGRGVDQYLQGNYANAWLEFSSAYQIKPLIALLNNMARCEVKIGRPGEALQHFRRFIATTPDDPDAEYIKQEIARLEAELGRRAAPVETGVVDVTPAPPPPRRIPVYTLAAGATTLALLVAGGVALGTVAARYGTLDPGCKPACPPLDVANLQQQSYAGYGLLGAAAVPAILTIVALKFELGKRNETTLRPLAGLRLTNPVFAFGSN